MTTTNVTLIKGDKADKNIDYRESLPQNMLAVPHPILGADGYMVCYPGLTQYASGVGIDRGAMYNERQGKHFRVSGEKLVEVTTHSSTVNDLGGVPGAGQAAMSYSFNTQAIVVDKKMFLYSSSTGLVEVTDSDLGEPFDLVWIDGYYFLTDGEYIFHTNIADEAAIDPLKFATAEFMPDPSLGVGKTADNKAMVFGRYTIEYFEDVATPNFAFTRIVTRALKLGIVATHAKCEANGNWYITGGRREDSVSVHVIESGVSGKVSTREVDKILAEYTEPELSDMRMESRSEDNLTLILIHLPNETLCFNETVAKLFGIEAAWTILKSGAYGASIYRGINGVFDARLGRWICGDKRDGKIGYLDNSVFTHYENVNEWVLYTPFMNIENQSIDQIEIETVPGKAPDSDATVAVSLTYDGITYGSEWFQLYGANYDYSQQFILRRLGYVNDWVGFKFRGATRARMAFSVLGVTHS